MNKEDFSVSEIDREYYELVKLCRHKHLNFDIPCSTQSHKDFVLHLMKSPSIVKIEEVEYYAGSKGETYVYNTLWKKGKANFNNKERWKSIIAMQRHLR